MTFKPVTMSGSAQVQSMLTALAPALTQLATTMVRGLGNVSGLLGASQAGATSVGQLETIARAGVSSALRSKVQTLTITPYNSGMRKGDRSYLTPENALQKLVLVIDEAYSRLLRCGQLEPDSHIAVIVLTFLAESEERLATSLSSFNAVFPLEELQRLERKAKALSTLETDKFIIPEAPSYPAWGQTSPANEQTGQNFNKTLGGLVGANEGQGVPSSLARLSQFAEKQAVKIADKLKQMDDMANAMQGQDDSWQGAYFEGDFVDVRQGVRGLVPPPDATTNGAYKVSALVCLMGLPENMTFYKESFGL